MQDEQRQKQGFGSKEHYRRWRDRCHLENGKILYDDYPELRFFEGKLIPIPLDRTAPCVIVGEKDPK